MRDGGGWEDRRKEGEKGMERSGPECLLDSSPKAVICPNPIPPAAFSQEPEDAEGESLTLPSRGS